MGAEITEEELGAPAKAITELGAPAEVTTREEAGVGGKRCYHHPPGALTRGGILTIGLTRAPSMYAFPSTTPGVISSLPPILWGLEIGFGVSLRP